MPSRRGRPPQMLKRLSVSAKVRSHGWAMPPCVRMRSTTPRAHGTVRSGPAPSRASWTSWRAAAATADSATRRMLLDVDVCRDGAGELEGPAETRGEPELERRRERHALRDRRGGRGPPASPSSSSPGRPRARAGPGAAPRSAPPGSRRRPRSACPPGRASTTLVTERPVHQSAQVQRVGPALHEGRPVRGVLHAVGEDECLLLLRGDVRAAEQLPERRRGQRGHPRTEEADAVRSPARRALLVLRGLGVRSDDDRHVGAGRTGRSGERRRRSPGRPTSTSGEPSAASPGAWIHARDTDWSVAVLLQTATGA